MELSNPNIYNLFPNPVFCFKANILKNEHQALIEECLSWKNASEGLKISNSGGWHSENTLFKSEQPNIKKLCNLFVNATNQALLKISPSVPIDKYVLLAEGWVNIGSKLSFNFPHNHPGFNLSGVYFVKVSKKRKDSGLLQFLDPRGSIKAYSIGVSEFKKPFNDSFTIIPEEKTLIIFPSWLHHWVTPNLEEEDRISVACNFRYQKK